MNDNTPAFQAFPQDVPLLEIRPIGFEVVKFTALDGDGSSPNRDVRYRLQNVSPTPSSSIFSVQVSETRCLSDLT